MQRSPDAAVAGTAPSHSRGRATAEADPRRNGRCGDAADARDAAVGREAGRGHVPLCEVGPGGTQRGHEDRGHGPAGPPLPGPAPIRCGRGRPTPRPPARSAVPQDREREPHPRRAPGVPGVLPRLLVGEHPADPGPGYAAAGDAHPGAVDGGSLPLLPQPDDAGNDPRLPGHGGRRGDDCRHGHRPLPGRLPSGVPQAPRGGGAGREVRRALPGVQARDALHHPAAPRASRLRPSCPRRRGPVRSNGGTSCGRARGRSGRRSRRSTASRGSRPGGASGGPERPRSHPVPACPRTCGGRWRRAPR